ncbi:hypothetical protein QR97_01775 [Streptomyces sp. PBH53]|uniref:hypothetical protein n=1 Tax=Streptomyces sp. PBH53 TaxID=1577075 RepID=UPI0006552692|nr:hypothetical protein [Streptomyces sp. PBH53]AKN68701.1 hypothetical protein QR97_01775 [Streptomyces sp. PBH53]
MRLPRCASPRAAATIAAGTAATITLAALAVASAPPSRPSPPRVVAVIPAGDDNGDGRIDEDESGWDCRVMGNRVCGPSAAPSCRR